MRALRGLAYGLLVGSLAGILSAAAIAITVGIGSASTGGIGTGIAVGFFVMLIGGMIGAFIGGSIGIVAGFVFGALRLERFAPVITAVLMALSPLAFVFDNEGTSMETLPTALPLLVASAPVLGGIGWLAGFYFRKATIGLDIGPVFVAPLVTPPPPHVPPPPVRALEMELRERV